MWQRLKPAFALVLLAPLIAEYLLGSLSFNQLVLFPVMVPMYGGGALLIRELVRRTGRGWPAILLLGLAYAIVEEGLATQSLFNPNYLGLRLLDYGFLPAWGIALPWTTYVIFLHVAWSILVPIGFVEALFPARRANAWLGKLGLVVSGVIYVLGVALIAFGTRQKEHFSASPTQLGMTALIAIVSIAVAFVRFSPRRENSAINAETTRWRPFTLGLVAFLAGSLFHLTMQLGSKQVAPVVSVGINLLLPGIVLGMVLIARKSGRWIDAQTDALALGGLFAYCWLGFFLAARLHGTSSIPGQLFPSGVVLLVVYFGVFRKRMNAVPGS